MSDRISIEARSGAIRRATTYLETLLEAPDATRGPLLRGTGPVAEFESLLALRSGFPNCLATASATAGMLAVVAAADLCGRKVLVPENLWSGTPGTLRFAGANVVKIPVTRKGTVDPKAVKEHLKSGETGALIVGEAENRHGSARALQRLAHQANVLFIEDSSWLPGISAPGDAPSIAEIQILSFGPGKPLSLGEGGAVLTRSADLYERLVARSQHPERCAIEGIECDPDHLALNARIHPVAAVLGVALLSATATP
jgi:dTDP-4-amino-4,6-dideoxygalactose transaminase